MNLLIAIAVLQAVLYGAIAWLSKAFAYGTTEQERPLLPMLALFAASFFLYLLAIRVAVRCSANRQLGWAIVVPAVLFRCLLLPTPPIQEIDIYRYLWDGAVTAGGLNPYQFSPAQARVVDSEADLNEELRRLAQLRDSSPAMSEILGRIHFSDLTTIYPPVSQAVFASGAWLTPDAASTSVRVLILKAVLSLFDVATIALIWLMLKAVALHPGLVVAYAWCPLVMKEFANTGRPDSIAVFLTTTAVYCVVRQFAHDTKNVSQMRESGFSRLSLWCWKRRGDICRTIVAAVVLALAIGAKLYAIVLLPVMCAAVWTRTSFAQAVVFAFVATSVSAAVLTPMLLTTPFNSEATELIPPPPQTTADDSAETIALSSPPMLPSSAKGLNAFVTRWEMNDFLFMLAVENLRPDETDSPYPSAWFVIVPDAWRVRCVTRLAELLETDLRTAAFMLVRFVLTGVFLAIAAVLAWRVYGTAEAHQFLEASFLTLAWFWLLSPTQNPWYWTWALPLLPFATGRAWYAVSGLTFAYYLRFWLQYQFPELPVLGTEYNGAHFFHFVVTWLEFAPWFVWLAIAATWRRLHPSQNCASRRSSSVPSFTYSTD